MKMPDSLFLCLIDEIYNDVREEGIVLEHMDIMILPQEEPELRCRVPAFDRAAAGCGALPQDVRGLYQREPGIKGGWSCVRTHLL